MSDDGLSTSGATSGTTAINYLAIVPLGLSIWTMSKYGLTSRKRSFLPLPVSVEKIRVAALEDLLVDIHQHTLMNIHICQKNLQFWRSRLQDEEYVSGQEGPYFRHNEPLYEDYDIENDEIRAALNVLVDVRYHLAKFLSKIYKAIDELKSSLTLLQEIKIHLNELDDSIAKVGSTYSTNLGGRSNLDNPAVMEDLSVPITEMKSHLIKLDEKVSSLVDKYRKPRTFYESWRLYAAGAITISVISMLFVSYKHSGFFDQFMDDATETLRTFLENPFQRKTEAIDSKHVQPTKEYLQRMLKNYTETRHHEFPEVSDAEKAEFLIYEMFKKQLHNPVKTLLTGDVLSAAIIQAQMIKTVAVTKLERYERLWAYAFHLAMNRAVPALSILLISLGLLLESSSQSKKSKAMNRRLISEVMKRSEQFLNVLFLEQDTNDVAYLHGLLLYTLDQFSLYTEKDARSYGEWESMREDIISLGKIKTQIECKRTMQRMLTTYECLRNC